VLFLITNVEICMISYKPFGCGGVSVFGDSVIAFFFAGTILKVTQFLIVIFCHVFYMLKIFGVNVYVCVF